MKVPFSVEQICEQLLKKKNEKPLEFVVFFLEVNARNAQTSSRLNLIFTKENSSIVHFRVRYAETDQMGIVYHGNYVQYLEMGRVEWLRELGFSYANLEKQGIILPVISVQMQFKKPARYDQELTVFTQLKSKPQVRIAFAYEIKNAANQILVTAHTVLVFLDAETRKPLRCPDYLLKKIDERIF